MVDVGGGARERFQSMNGEEPESLVDARSENYYHYSDPHHHYHSSPPPTIHHIPPTLAWRHALQGNGSSARNSLVECVPPDLLQIKTDPEALASLCGTSGLCVGVEGGSTEDPEDARARGQLLQEITRVAETYEPYSASPAPTAEYRSYEIPRESSSHPEYIRTASILTQSIPDTPQWYWSKSPSEEQSQGVSATGSILLAPDQLSNSGTCSVQHSVSSQLIPEAVSSTLPAVSDSTSTTSGRTCSSTHELTHSRERQFSCDECGTTFLAKAMLIRHRKVHTGEKPYRCDVCETRFTESGSLKVHKRLHSGEKPFKCDVCDVAFNGAGMLATHKRKHTGEKPYTCEECGKAFRLLSTLKSHKRRHTGEKPFVCEVCGSSFTQRAAMQRHKRIHSDHKPWECDQCGYKFREKENLRKHIALHMIKLQHLCTVCGAGFNQAKKLETHKMVHNGGDRPYQCNKCPSTFTNPKYLTQHKKRVHNKKGAIRCEECNGTFKRKESLRSHMRIHKGERPYVCDECGAAFNQRGSLTKHMKIHSYNSSSSVSKCQSPEIKAQKQELLSMSHPHQSVNSSVAEDAPFSCPLCQSGFSSLEEMTFHKRSSHPGLKNSTNVTVSPQDDDSSEHIRDKYICDDCDQTFFRRRQLKAHKKYCPCRCPSYQFESPEVHVAVTSLPSDSKEVDAMKLLTAALGVTGNDHDLNSHHHQTHRLPSSPQHYPSPSLSPHHYPSSLSPHHYPASSALSSHHYVSSLPLFTAALEKHVDHGQDVFTYTSDNGSKQQIHSSHVCPDDPVHVPLQQELLHLPHIPTQLPDHIRYSSSDQYQQMVHQQNALKQLSEDNIMKLAEEHSQQQQLSQNSQPSSYLRQTEHSSSRVSHYSLNHSLSHETPQQLHDHLPSPLDHDQSCHTTQTSQQLHDNLSLPLDNDQTCHTTQHHNRHNNMQQDSLPQNSRHNTHIQQPMKQHKYMLGQQGQSPIEPSSTHTQLVPLVLPVGTHEQLEQNHHGHLLQVERSDEQQFYRDSSLSLSSQQHLPHHHQHLYPHQNIPQTFIGNGNNCNDMASVEHHHNQNQNQQHSQHFYKDEDKQGKDKVHYHHQPLLHQSHHAHHLPLEDSNIIKTENDLGPDSHL